MRVVETGLDEAYCLWYRCDCGVLVAEGSNFCQGCGERITEFAQPTPEPKRKQEEPVYEYIPGRHGVIDIVKASRVGEIRRTTPASVIRWRDYMRDYRERKANGVV